jgi:hypothetical protein
MGYELGATDSPACLGDIVYGYDVNTLDDENTVVIPNSGAAKVRLTTKPIYADDMVTVRHYEYTLNVETTIAAHTTSIGHDANNNTEFEVGRFRQILSTPGLQLNIYPRGVGLMPVVHGPNHPNVVASYVMQDVTGGPFPQEVMVEPLIGNQAIYVKWTVVFNVVHCDLLTFVENNLLLTEYTLESDYDTDDEGDLVFTLSGTLTFKNPQTTQNDYLLASAMIDRLSRNVATNAPFTGFKRSRRVSHSRDKRTYKFVIKYTQIKSDSAYPLLTRNISGKDSISSSLLSTNMYSGSAFYTWLREINISVTMPTGVNKIEAWNIFLDILRQRFRNLSPISKLTPILKGEVPLDPTPEAEEAPWILPLSLEATNTLYSREISFKATFVMVSNLLKIWNTSRLFTRLHNKFLDEGEEDERPDTRSNQWYEWDLPDGQHLDGRGANKDIGGIYRTYSENIPIDVTHCDLYGGGSTFPNVTAPRPSIKPTYLPQNENDPDWPANKDDITTPSVYEPYPEGSRNEYSYPPIKDTKTVDPRQSYMDFKSTFEVIEDNKTQVLDFLQDYNLTKYKNPATTGLDRGNSTKMTLNGISTPAQAETYTEDISGPNVPVRDVLSRGAPRYYIRLTGYAIRVGYPASAPVIVSIGGKEAIRVGQNRVSSTNLAVSAEFPIYLTCWDTLYTINGTPIRRDGPLDILEDTKGNYQNGLYS